MTDRSRRHMVRPTRLTWIAVAGTLTLIALTVALLLAHYSSLPSLLPVHFSDATGANGWQYRTYARVLIPAFVQIVLTLIFGGIGILLLARSHDVCEEDAPDIVAASTATEAVALVMFVWVAFQAYAGFALVMMWQSSRARLGGPYNLIAAAGILLSVLVGVHAQRQLRRPSPREFVPEHWRFGHLYRNRSDPALFVPTRDGTRWTLNFGRPVAAALLGAALVVGIVGPSLILHLLLR